MNFVITMAGRGERFVKAGYKIPKMLINVNGKSLLEWSLSSLPIHLATNIIFVGLLEHEENYHISSIIKKKFPKLNSSFIFLDQVTRGQAETVYKSKDLLFLDRDLVVFNIDTYFESKTLEKDLLNSKVDGVLGAFISDSINYSYALLDSNNYINETAEKKTISINALTGLYHFKYTNDFLEIFEYYNASYNSRDAEMYIAPMYNGLIKKGKKFILNFVDKIHILGTPQEIEIFRRMKNES